MKRNLSLMALLLSATCTMAAVGTAEAAGTLTGKIGVQLVIGAGCTVSNNNSSGGTNNWGAMDFGQYASLTNAIDGTVIGTDGSDTVSVSCSTGLSPALKLDGGLYGSSSVRNMSSDGGKTVIPYRLYSDSARSSEIAINDAVSLNSDGTQQNIPVYGRVIPADQSTTAPQSGTYTDTVTATLTW